MVIAIFVGGIILGFSLGFATMAVVAAREARFQTEEAQEVEGYLTGACSPSRKFSLSWRARLQTPVVLLTPWL